jgi:hypothetical protein
MNWFAPLDLYCERLAPGLRGEPLNAISNAGFLVAAGVGWAACRRSGRADAATPALAALVAVIGVGSFLFHTFANGWSVIADTAPITLFIYSYLGLVLRRFFGLGWVAVGAFLLLFLASSFPVEALLRPLLSGSAAYVPAFLALGATGTMLSLRSQPTGRYLLAAAGVFLISLVFRTIDQPLCSVFPAGTHFLWHLLNAATLAILLVAAGRHVRPLPSRG